MRRYGKKNIKNQAIIEQQDRIEHIRASLEPHFDTAVNQAASAFLGGLGDQNSPSDADVAAASAAAHSVLKRHALSETWLSAVVGSDEVSQDQRSRIELVFDTVLPPPTIPQPQDASTMSSARLALAAAVGAVFGMMVLTPFARLLLDMRDTGLFIGAPIGAALLVLASWHAAHNKWIKNMLVGVLGVATLAEVWAFLSGGGVFGRLWRALGGQRSSSKRILIYALVILVLVFSKRVPRIDRRGYERTVTCILSQWLDEAVIVLAFLLHPSSTTQPVPDTDSMLCDLVAKIKALPAVGRDNIEFAIQELIQETKNMGFAGDDGVRQLVWEESMREKYETFGHIEPGDVVFIVRDSVRFKDVVKQKGLVRKKREWR